MYLQQIQIETKIDLRYFCKITKSCYLTSEVTKALRKHHSHFMRELKINILTS
jgi:hypothetical protein